MKHIALGHFPPDDGAGNDFAPVDDWRKNHHIESMFLPEFFQELHVSRLLVSETKILTDQDGFYPQVANQNQLGEVRGGEPCKFQCERQNDRGFQANSSEPFRAHWRSEEHTSELQSQSNLVCRLLLEKKKTQNTCLQDYTQN